MYIFRKLKPFTLPHQWFIAFLIVKIVEYLYGVVNYTPWIKDIITHPVIAIYRLFMFSIDSALLVCILVFLNFLHSGNTLKLNTKARYYYFLPAILMFPVNYYITFHTDGNLLVAFYGIRSLFVVTLIHFYYLLKDLYAYRQFILAMILWNAIRLLSEVLYQSLDDPPADYVSGITYVIAEFFMMFGFAAFIIRVISKPKIFKFDTLDIIKDSDKKQDIRQKLDDIMKADELYKIPDLSSSNLADALNITVKDLNAYFTHELNMNFFQYISYVRIEESQRLLSTTRKSELTIEQIMYDVGFNSKSVYYTTFKENTGMTPTQYRKKFQ